MRQSVSPGVKQDVISPPIWRCYWGVWNYSRRWSLRTSNERLTNILLRRSALWWWWWMSVESICKQTNFHCHSRLPWCACVSLCLCMCVCWYMFVCVCVYICVSVCSNVYILFFGVHSRQSPCFLSIVRAFSLCHSVHSIVLCWTSRKGPTSLFQFWFGVRLCWNGTGMTTSGATMAAGAAGGRRRRTWSDV